MLERGGRRTPEVSVKMTKAFLRAVENCPNFAEAVEIVKRNSLGGGIWLIGGFVYKNIVRELSGVLPPPGTDFDFIVENPAKEFVLPAGWVVGENSFGNPKFRGPEFEIDFVPLNNVYSIKRRYLSPTIENFLLGVPLTVQAIVFDLIGRQVVGDRGIRAIETGTVRVNNEPEARHVAELKGISVQEMVQAFADSLQFQAVL